MVTTTAQSAPHATFLRAAAALASQRWRRVDGQWRIAAHRYIPWSADGATAVATLRCDRRGCVLLGREINTREVVQRGAVLMDKFG